MVLTLLFPSPLYAFIAKSPDSIMGRYISVFEHTFFLALHGFLFFLAGNTYPVNFNLDFSILGRLQPRSSFLPQCPSKM